MIHFVLTTARRTPERRPSLLFDEQGRSQLLGYAAFSTVSKWPATDAHRLFHAHAHDALVLGRRDDTLQMGLWTTAGAETIRLPFAITARSTCRKKALAQPLTVTPDPLLEAPADGLRDLPVLPRSPDAIRPPFRFRLFWPLEAMGTAPERRGAAPTPHSRSRMDAGGSCRSNWWRPSTRVPF